MRHDRMLGDIGWAGLAFGIAVTVAGRFGGEFANLMGGYGTLVIASAAYLLVGLAVRRTLARSASPSSPTVAPRGRLRRRCQLHDVGGGSQRQAARLR